MMVVAIKWSGVISKSIGKIYVTPPVNLGNTISPAVYTYCWNIAYEYVPKYTREHKNFPAFPLRLHLKINQMCPLFAFHIR